MVACALQLKVLNTLQANEPEGKRYVNRQGSFCVVQKAVCIHVAIWLTTCGFCCCKCCVGIHEWFDYRDHFCLVNVLQLCGGNSMHPDCTRDFSTVCIPAGVMSMLLTSKMMCWGCSLYDYMTCISGIVQSACCGSASCDSTVIVSTHCLAAADDYQFLHFLYSCHKDL